MTATTTRTAIISNGVVINTIMAPAGYVSPTGTAVASATARIGDAYDGSTFTTPTTPATPPTQAQLLAYAETLRGKIAAGGISVNIAPSGATPQLVDVGTDTGGLALLANAVQLTSTAPGTPYDWDQDAPVTLTGAQIIAIQVAVGLWMQQLFAEKSAIRAAIAAGTITTTAQIDDPTTVGINAWASNS